METIVMAGRGGGTGAGWTIGTAGACRGDWMDAGERRVGVGGCTGRTIGVGCVGGTGVWMGACKGGLYICESGRGGTFRFRFGF